MEIHSVARTTSFRFVASLVAIAMVVVFTSSADAQGPLRRAGERVRGAVQERLNQPLPSENERARRPLNLRGLLAPSTDAVPSKPADQAGARGAAPTPAASAQEPSSVVRSNYNRPLGKLSEASDLPGVLGLVLEPAPPRQVPGRTPVPTRGAFVVETVAGSGGEAAGIRQGDLVVAVDGRIVNTVDDLVARLRRLSPGDNVNLRIVRDGKLLTANTVLAGVGGKLDAATYAQVRQAAGLAVSPEITAANSRATKSTGNSEAAQPSSSLGGLGRIVGGWLGGGSGGTANSNPSSAAQPAAAETPSNSPAAAAEDELPPPAPQPSQVDEPNVAPELDGSSDSLPPPAAFEPV
jgi:membrane-associated protease RseP (regulator of RpoE activity)